MKMTKTLTILAAVGLAVALSASLLATAGPRPHATMAAAAATVGGDDAVATVNGEPVSRAYFNELLTEAYGNEMLQAVVALRIVKHEAAKRKITVTPAEVAAEEKASFPARLKNLAPADRDRLLDEYLASNGLTRVHWRLAIERNAYLRKLAEMVVGQPNEGELRELFRQEYGAKVHVRHIQVNTPAQMREVQQRLAKGEAFADVAKALSVHKAAAEGGLLEPFSVTDAAVPEEIRSVAFAMKKPGEVSSQIIVRGSWHLLQLVERIEPENVRFEDKRAELSQQVRDGMIRVQMNLLLRSLPAVARIEVLDPVIKKQAEAQQAAEQPAGKPILP